MSIRLADPRLLVDVFVSRVTLLGSLPGWPEALATAGIEVVEADADLVVAEARLARRAAALGAPAVVLVGVRPRPLRRAGYLTRAIFVRPGGSGLRLYVPVDARRATRHLLRSPLAGRSAPKRAVLVAYLLALRAGLPLRSALTIGTRTGAAPCLLAAAKQVGLPAVDDWCLITGDGDDLQRLVWLCFDGGDRPAWAVKCGRVPGSDAPFAREEAALRALDVLPTALRRHAPRLLGRIEVDRLPVAVETAGAGQPLQSLLPARLGERGRRVVLDVAEWVLGVARSTRQPPAALAPELERLGGVVVPAWVADGASAGLTAMLSAIPGVLQHNDLGSWNIVSDGETFTVVDWESTTGCGLPLWDLVYFLTDALTRLRATSSADVDGPHMLALLRGELEESSVLFDYVRRAARELELPAETIGPIVTLGWLHHGLSANARAQRGRAFGAVTRGASQVGPLQKLARPWLADPALGVSWPALTSA